MAITQQDIKVMYQFAKEMAHWVNGGYINKKNTDRFLVKFEQVKHLLPKYVSGTLYRACWISKSEFKIASKATKLELTTSKKSVQSWTDKFDTATEIYNNVLHRSHGSNYINCIVEAKIPGKNILMSLRDIESIFQKYSSLYDKTHDYDNIFEDTLIDMSEYYEEREWIVNIDGPVKISSIKIAIETDGWDDIGWQELKTASTNMTLVLDDSGLLTLEQEHVQLPMAASFQSKLLR